MTSALFAADVDLKALDGTASNLQFYRDDGRWTLVLIRKDGCESCDVAEIELQQWLDGKNEADVTAIGVNIDALDRQESVNSRLQDNQITYPNFLVEDPQQLSAVYRSLTDSNIPELPVGLLFGEQGDFMGEEIGAEFDWALLDEFMLPEGAATELARLLAGESDEPEVKAPFNSHLNEVGRDIRDKLERWDLLRAKATAESALMKNPDYSSLIVENARLSLLSNRISPSDPLNYQLDESVFQEIESDLLRVLKEHPTEIDATALLAELYSVAGKPEQAAATIDNADDDYKRSSWFTYNSALLSQVRGNSEKAMEQLQPLLDTDVRTNSAMNMFQFQQLWQLTKTIALEQPEIDPIRPVREGLIERISEDRIVEEIKSRGSSEKPLMVIISSEDPLCAYCVNTAELSEPFLKENQNKYQFVYASIEPWYNYKYARWAGVIPKTHGIPTAMLFARSQYMYTGSPPNSVETRQWYEDNNIYSLMQSENPGELNYPAREAMAQLHTAWNLWNEQKSEVSAYASVREGGLAAWGTSDGFTGSQAEVGKRALDVCTERAKRQGITDACQLYEPDAD